MEIITKYGVGDIVYVLKNVILKCTVLGVKTETDKEGTKVWYNVMFHTSKGSAYIHSDYVYGSVKELVSNLEDNIQ